MPPKMSSKPKAKAKGKPQTKSATAAKKSQAQASKRAAEGHSEFFDTAPKKKRLNVEVKELSNAKQAKVDVMDAEDRVPAVRIEQQSRPSEDLPNAPQRCFRGVHGVQDLRTLQTPKKTVGVAQKLCNEAVKTKAPEVLASQKLCDENLDLFMEDSGVTPEGRARLVDLAGRWGQSRMEQIVDLWTFLGDGTSRPTITQVVQVFGPAGSGKTTLVRDYLDSTGQSYAWLNCGLLGSLVELHKYLFQDLSRLLKSGLSDTKEPKPWEDTARFPKSLDQLHLELMPLLQEAADVGLKRQILVVDHTQELQRFDKVVVQQLARLPEMLQTESICIVMVGRLPLEWIAVPSAKEPPAVPFDTFTLNEARSLLKATLTSESSKTPKTLGNDLLDAFLNLFMHIAYLHVNDNFRILLQLCKELWQEFQGYATMSGDSSLQSRLIHFQGRMEVAVHERLSLGPRPPPETELMQVVPTALLTRCEKRLLVAGFLAAHNNPDDDVERFVPTASRSRRARKKKKVADPGPVCTRVPRTFRFCRLIAIYHYLVRIKGLSTNLMSSVLGTSLREQFNALRELGFFSQVGEHTGIDKDPKLSCRAPLELIKDCAADLGIQLGEYLIEYRR